MSNKKRRKRRPRKAPSPKPTPEEASEAAAAKPASVSARRRRAANLDERPPAPWGNVPLVELVVLVGIVLLIAGFIVHGSQGTLMIATGAVLCSIAGLELSIR